jgi:hypothetical protein
MTATASTILGNGSAPREITHAGKTYRVGKLTQKGMSAFSDWLIDRARQRVVAFCGDDQVQMAKMLAELREDALSGVYEFLEPVVAGRPKHIPETRVIDGKEVLGHKVVIEGGALNTHHGRIHLAAILCGCNDDEALSLLITHPAEMNHLLELALAESFPETKRDLWEPDDPNAPGAKAPQQPPEKTA